MPAYIDFTDQKIGRVKVIENVSKSPSRWKCLCDCGKEFICLARSFVRGATFECHPCRFERRRGIDLIGRQFGRWTVIERQQDKRGKTAWLVRCDCGVHGLVATSHLGKRGKSMSCGCLGRKEKSVRANKTLYPPSHLTSTTSIYNIRARILQACYNEKNRAYYKYGEKGIGVCELWRNGAKDFHDWCIENDWKEDDIVYLKNGCNEFSPENCIVVGREEWARLELSKKVTIHGKELSVFEWSELVGLSHHTILDRLKRGYTDEEAIFAKSHKNSGRRRDWPDEEIKKLYEDGLSLADIGRKLGERYTAVGQRLRLMGVEVDISVKRRKYQIKQCIKCSIDYEPTGSKQIKCFKCSKIK